MHRRAMSTFLRVNRPAIQTPQQLGTVNDLYDNAVPICNGTYDVEHYSKNSTTWTVGANYEIANNMSAYIRANNGTHFDDFDNGIRGVKGDFAPVQTVKNYEVGFKYQSSLAYVDLNVYHKQFTGIQYQELNAAGAKVGPISTYGSDSRGVDLDRHLDSDRAPEPDGGRRLYGRPLHSLQWMRAVHRHQWTRSVRPL